MAEPGKTGIGPVVIDRGKFDEMVAFCTRTLGYQQRGPRGKGGTLLHDPQGSGPNLAIRREPNAPGHFSWSHLDPYSSDPAGEAERQVRLGATVPKPVQADRDFVTLVDPDGIRSMGWRHGGTRSVSGRTDRPRTMPRVESQETHPFSWTEMGGIWAPTSSGPREDRQDPGNR